MMSDFRSSLEAKLNKLPSSGLTATCPVSSSSTQKSTSLSISLGRPPHPLPPLPHRDVDNSSAKPDAKKDSSTSPDDNNILRKAPPLLPRDGSISQSNDQTLPTPHGKVKTPSFLTSPASRSAESSLPVPIISLRRNSTGTVPTGLVSSPPINPSRGNPPRDGPTPAGKVKNPSFPTILFSSPPINPSSGNPPLLPRDGSISQSNDQTLPTPHGKVKTPSFLTSPAPTSAGKPPITISQSVSSDFRTSLASKLSQGGPLPLALSSVDSSASHTPSLTKSVSDILSLQSSQLASSDFRASLEMKLNSHRPQTPSSSLPTIKINPQVYSRTKPQKPQSQSPLMRKISSRVSTFRDWCTTEAVKISNPILSKVKRKYNKICEKLNPYFQRIEGLHDHLNSLYSRIGHGAGHFLWQKLSKKITALQLDTNQIRIIRDTFSDVLSSPAFQAEKVAEYLDSSFETQPDQIHLITVAMAEVLTERDSLFREGEALIDEIAKVTEEASDLSLVIIGKLASLTDSLPTDDQSGRIRRSWLGFFKTVDNLLPSYVFAKIRTDSLSYRFNYQRMENKLEIIHQRLLLLRDTRYIQHGNELGLEQTLEVIQGVTTDIEEASVHAANLIFCRSYYVDLKHLSTLDPEVLQRLHLLNQFQHRTWSFSRLVSSSHLQYVFELARSQFPWFRSPSISHIDFQEINEFHFEQSGQVTHSSYVILYRCKHLYIVRIFMIEFYESIDWSVFANSVISGKITLAVSGTGAGLATGAGIGAIVDIATAGLTLGLGTIIGASVGAGVGFFGGIAVGAVIDTEESKEQLRNLLGYEIFDSASGSFNACAVLEGYALSYLLFHSDEEMIYELSKPRQVHFCGIPPELSDHDFSVWSMDPSQMIQRISRAGLDGFDLSSNDFAGVAERWNRLKSNSMMYLLLKCQILMMWKDGVFNPTSKVITPPAYIFNITELQVIRSYESDYIYLEVVHSASANKFYFRWPLSQVKTGERWFEVFTNQPKL